MLHYFKNEIGIKNFKKKADLFIGNNNFSFILYKLFV